MSLQKSHYSIIDPNNMRKTMDLKLSHYHRVSPCFFDELNQRYKRVIFSTRTATIRIIDDYTWKLLGIGEIASIHPDIIDDLITIEILVPSNENELETIIARNETIRYQDDNLYLVVQPTAFCQLGCHYCGQEHTNKLMTEENQQRFLERARRQLETQKFRSLTIGWFGAEPLVGLSVMRSLTPKLQSMAASYGCSYNAKIVTNGLALTDKIATELVKDLSIDSIEITLDGTAEYHDKRRIQKSGLPSFDKIFANVKALVCRQDLDVQVNIRCNVDGENYESVSLLLQQLADEGIQDRIHFYVAPIHSWGNDAHTRSLSKEEFAAWEIQWFSEMIELGFNPKLLPNRNPIVCMAVQPHAELIDAYGNVFNCSEVSYVPTYGTPNEYAIAHLSGLPMPGQRERLGNFNQDVRQGKYSCSTCSMLPVCGGACPKSWLEGIEPCPSPKYNIEERLLLSYALSRLPNVYTP